VVKFRDWTMKEFLLTMLEWHACAIHGWRYDTWHSGRFLAEWTDPATWESLHQTFGHFEAADSWRALLASMTLFRRLARQTGARLGYAYPAMLDEQVTQLVNELYVEDISLGQAGEAGGK
jgi:aminoglycoside 6-adenylyltransferase